MCRYQPPDELMQFLHRYNYAEIAASLVHSGTGLVSEFE